MPVPDNQGASKVTVVQKESGDFAAGYRAVLQCADARVWIQGETPVEKAGGLIP